MELKELNNLGLPPKPNKVEKVSSSETRIKNRASPEAQSPEQIRQASDLVEISDQARELQKNDNDLEVARKLLSNLPSYRAYIVYQALAKLRAGIYSEEQIVEEVAERMLESGDLDDIVNL